jgi:hypothetical protein
MATPRRRPLLAAGLVTATLFGAIFGSQAFAATTNKQFALDVQPPCVPAASSGVTMSATITNETAGQQLGSANLTAPSVALGAFSAISNLSVTSPDSTTETATLDPANARTIQLRNLTLGFNHSATVTFTVTTPTNESTAAGSYTWTASAKQSNDYNGSPGNEVLLDASNSHLATFVGTCRAVFTVQPNDTRVGEAIRNGLFSTGDAVTVEVRNGFNQLVVNSNALLTLSIAHDPNCDVTGDPRCPAHLSATGTTANATGGVATFTAPFSIDKSELGYSLSASGYGITAGTSGVFDVVSNGIVCSGPGCKRNASTGTGANQVDVTVAAPNAASGDVLSLSLDVEALGCAGYTPLSDTPIVTFEVTGTSYRQVTIVVPAGLAIRSASQDRVCYSSDTKSFVDRSGVTRSAGQSGLLADCKNKLDPTNLANPCQLPTTVDKTTGAHTVVFFAPFGATRGRT